MDKKIVGGVVTTPVRVFDKFELIETIKVDGADAVREIARITDTNGKPLALKRLSVKIKSSAGTGQGLVIIRTYNNNTQIGGASLSGAVNTGVRHSYADFYTECGYWDGHMATPIGDESSPAAMAGISFAYKLTRKVETFPCIDKFTITSNVDIPVGTKIDIWGVRA